MISFAPLSLRAVAQVAEAMRPADAREIWAGWPVEHPLELARHHVAHSALGTLALHEARPVAALGVVPLAATLYAAWMFATPEFPRVAQALTRRVRRVMAPQLLARGATRLEARSHLDHVEAHRWLEHLGAVREAVLPDHGKHRETFVLYAWRLSDVHVRRRPLAPGPSAPAPAGP